MVDTNLIILFMVLGILIGIVYSLRRIYRLEKIILGKKARPAMKKKR